MLRYVCQFLTRKSWTLKLSIWKITAFRMNQLRFWCSLTTLVFNVGWAAQISGAGVIFGCLCSKNDWFEWISSICCDLTFFWWSFHRNLVIWILFGDWEGKVFQNWVPWNEIGGLGRSILHPDFRVELPSVWSIFFRLVPSGLVEKAGLKKIDMSDYILISRKKIATRDFWEYKKTQSWWISPKKHPNFPVFHGGFTRVFWKIPSTVNFPHAAFATESWPASHRWTKPSIPPTRHWPYAEDDRLCGGAYNCGPLGF